MTAAPQTAPFFSFWGTQDPTDPPFGFPLCPGKKVKVCAAPFLCVPAREREKETENKRERAREIESG